ncbi:hypothetical protein CesoFtcFv8_010765 [Champsocephalus esox]|uniref:SGNH hydrolase-type esterase domain-containing protein n=1 Tax=Champsocephalus esox TaxID=159716 RepID=A0AAN8GW04_9TELE|nr:hypothetical protein CesoFtcFv8_010765 [Champsocephalus esox]
MPPFSTDDFHKLLQKMAVLEMKMQRLEVNVEVNGLCCGNDTTLPVLQNSGKEYANSKLVSSYKDSKEQEGCVPGNKSTSGSPPWNSLGAKPKSKSFPWDLGGRITGRAQHSEICDATGWPALLSPRKSASSTPKQPWTAAKGRITNNPPKPPSVPIQNRYAPLTESRRSLSDDLDNPSSSHSRVRTNSYSKSKSLEGKLTTGPETLIVGDSAVRDVKGLCSKNNNKVLCFPKDTVSDLAEKILRIGAEHPTVKNVVLHIGTNDVVKQQSEVLKKDFQCLLETASSLNAEVFISGPLPPVRRGVERFSRLFALNTWLSTACTDHSVHFIDNFNFFWDRRHLFKANGVCLNKSGVKLFISNIFNCLRHQSVPSAKDKRQEESKQKIDTTHRAENPEEVSLHPSEECTDYGRPMKHTEESPPPVTPPPINAFENTPFTLSPSPTILEIVEHMKEIQRAGTDSFLDFKRPN